MEFACADLLLKPLTFIGPNNYLQLPGLSRKPRMSVKFRFRSWDYTGLLMFTRFADNLGSLELGLSEGQVNISLIQSEKRLQFAAGKSASGSNRAPIQQPDRNTSVGKIQYSSL